MATLKDIAEKAGVSIGTVDRILHNRGRFSPDTAARVRRIVRELDYRPNLMARHLSRSSECRIGLFLPSPEQDSGYWSLPMAGARRAERELEAFGLSLEVINYNRYNARSFIEAGEILVNGGFDGILMAPLREDEARVLLEKIGTDVPLVFFDTDLPGSRRMCYIGQDSYQSGRLAARLLGLAAGERRHGRAGGASFFLIVAPGVENEHLDDRIQGFRDGIDAPVELCRVNVESDHDTEALRKALETRVGRNTAGVFVADASAHYVADFISDCISEYKAGFSDSGYRKRIPILGYDLVEANRKWMEEGAIDFLLTQRPVEQGYSGVNRLFRKIFRGEEAPENDFTPIDIVTKENLIYMNPEENE